ncbi:uncharacterized protein DEA37_0002930, partial [Paragonimus westermani]
ASLVNAPSSTNLHELRSVLGALQYYSCFSPNFAQRATSFFVMSPISNFPWSAKDEKTFRTLLRHLQTTAVLFPFSVKDQPSVITDAPSTRTGAVLEQCGIPVIYISRRLSKTERGYSQTQRKVPGVYWAVRRLHGYLFGQPFTIASDHDAL